MGAAALNNRWAVWTERPSAGRRRDRGFSRWRADVNAWLQSPRGQALLPGAGATGDLTSMPVPAHHPENPGALQNYGKYTPPVPRRQNSTARMSARLFTTWFSKYFHLTVEAQGSEQKKRLLSKYQRSLTTFWVTQELRWRRTPRRMLFSCQLSQNPFCSPCIGGSF